MAAEGRRQAHGVEPEEMAQINAEIQALLAERLPRKMGLKFDWEVWATAMLARVGGIFDSITALVGAGRRADAEVALRTMYEQVTLFCWIAIDPEKHLREWQENSESRWRQFHAEARDRYGFEVISEEEAEELAEGRMRTLEQRSEAIDRYWAKQIEAFEPPAPKKAHKQPLKSFRGLYTAIYRTTSRVAHAEVDALQPYVYVDERRKSVTVSAEERVRFGRAALAVPLIGFFLLVHHVHFAWPSEELARSFSVSLLWEPGDGERMA